MVTIRAAGYDFQVPPKVQAEGGRAVGQWLADELTSKQLVPFNPLEVGLGDLEAAVDEVEDPAALEAMFACEWRDGGREVLRARQRALDDTGDEEAD